MFRETFQYPTDIYMLLYYVVSYWCTLTSIQTVQCFSFVSRNVQLLVSLRNPVARYWVRGQINGLSSLLVNCIYSNNVCRVSMDSWTNKIGTNFEIKNNILLLRLISLTLLWPRLFLWMLESIAYCLIVAAVIVTKNKL